MVVVEDTCIRLKMDEIYFSALSYLFVQIKSFSYISNFRCLFDIS